jgi:uncharacterized protein (TIGR00369 family)
VPRNLDKWLGDGGMPLISHLGAALTGYGEGWAIADWTPTDACCNPAGAVQAGVQAVLLDAVMNFAALAALEAGDRAATLEMKVSTMRPARAGDRLSVRGEVVRLGRDVAFLQGFVDSDGERLSHATGSFILFRGAASAS